MDVLTLNVFVDLEIDVERYCRRIEWWCSQPSLASVNFVCAKPDIFVTFVVSARHQFRCIC